MSSKSALAVVVVTAWFAIGFRESVTVHAHSERDAQDASEARISSVDLLVPSASTGGNLAVRLWFNDDPAQYRYAEGAPVLVVSPGGHGFGSLAPQGAFTDFGFIVVTFLYPGGFSDSYASDGTYDYRGPSCVAALRDVVLFGLGLKADSEARTINEVIPGEVLTTNVGVLSSSNGGPTTTAACALYGETLTGFDYLVYYESPTNDQTVNADLGSIGFDCDSLVDGDGNGLFRDDGKNLRYTTYGPSSCTVDYTTLAYDPTVVRRYMDPAELYPPADIAGVVFLDNNLNGVLDSVGTPACYDLDGNGLLDLDEDYPFTGKITFLGPGMVKLFLSTEVSQAAADQGVFPSSWPIHLATPPQAETFWFCRDSTNHYASLASNLPDLAVMLTFHRTDHVQAANDQPHIQQAYDGFRGQGMWCRLNPDYEYIADCYGTPLVGTPDNPANCHVESGFMKDYAEPDTTEMAEAAVCEMADRVYYGVWDINLDSVLPLPSPTPTIAPTEVMSTPTPVPSGVPKLYVVSMMHAEESQPFHTDEALYFRHANNLRLLQDIFINHNAKLDFGPDWTFIEGVKTWDPQFLLDLLANGHGVHTHAHETSYDLAAVNQKLEEAGLSNRIANGGFLQSGPGGTNWVGYVASFLLPGGTPRFRVAIGYKNPVTQIPDGTGFIFRPSTIGDWLVEDPNGPLVYIGCNMPEEVGAGTLDFTTIRDIIDSRLLTLQPDKINTLYWHDSLHNYPNQPAAQARFALWEQLFAEYLDPLTAQGRIEWLTFAEMAARYEQQQVPTVSIPAIVGLLLGLSFLMGKRFARKSSK